jgi:hypothetical protein
MHTLKGKNNSQKRLTYTLATRVGPLDVLVLAQTLVPNCRLVKLAAPQLSGYTIGHFRIPVHLWRGEVNCTNSVIGIPITDESVSR